MTTQFSLFQQGEDLPLFNSGTRPKSTRRPPFKITLKFHDPNQPDITETADSETSARAGASHLLQQFAAVRCVWVDDMTTDPQMRHIANGAGEYLFSIPISSVCA